MPKRKTKARIDPKRRPRNLQSLLSRRRQRRRSLLRSRTNLTLRKPKANQLLSKRSQRDLNQKPLRAKSSKKPSLRIKHLRSQVKKRRRRKRSRSPKICLSLMKMT